MRYCKLILAMTGCLLLALALHGAEERKPIEKKPAGQPANDQEFVAWGLACEIAEIKFAERALKQTSNKDLIEFSRKITAHHVSTRDALLKKAKELKAPIVEGLEKHHRESYERLGKLEGAEFDREYTRCLIEGHEKGVKMYEKWAKDARDPGLRDLAARTLLVLKDHLEQARKLSGGFKP